MELIHENKFTTHRQIRKLSEIIKADAEVRNRALKVLGSKDGDIVAAYEVFEMYCEKGSWSVIQKALNVTETLSLQQLKMAVQDSKKLDLLKKLNSSIKNLQKAMADIGGFAAV